MSAPWDATIEGEVRQSAQHIYEVSVYEPPGSAPGPKIPLQVQSCEITYDPGWSPYVQGTIVAAMPDETTLAKLDPRKVVTVRVDAGYVRPGGRRDLHPMCTKTYLSRRRASYPDNTVTLQFQGAEYLGDSVAAVSPTDSPQAGVAWTPTTTTGQAINAVLAYTGVPTLIGTGAAIYETDADLLVGWVPAGETWPGRLGENSLEAARDVADRNDLWLYADEHGQFRVWYRDVLRGGLAFGLRPGADGTLTGADLDLSREGFANELRVIYAWNLVTSSSGGKDTVTSYQTVGKARVTSGPWATATVGRVQAVIERSLPAGQTVANSAAASLLSRYVARGLAENVDSVAAYWLRPGDQVGLRAPDAAASTFRVVRSITFRLHEGAMTLDVATRDPYTIDPQ